MLQGIFSLCNFNKVTFELIYFGKKIKLYVILQLHENKF